MAENNEILTAESNNPRPELTAAQIAVFRSRLRVLRKSTKITQDALSEKLHLLHQDVSALERGRKKVTWKIVEDAAEAFGVPISQLIEKKDASGDSKNYCARLLSLSQILYDTPISDDDKIIIERAIDLLESVIYA